MKIYLNVDANYRVRAWGSTKGSQSDIELTVDDNHEVLRNPFIFTYMNGVLQKDTAYQQQLIENHETELSPNEKIKQLEKDTADLWYALMQGGIA